MPIIKYAILSLSLLLSLETGARAASFVVSPIKVFFNKKLSKDKITIINNGLEDVSLQVTVKKWTQNESGIDQYIPTKDIIFFPKLFSIKKGDQRLIRLGYRGKVDQEKEITFRLFVDEIPNRKREGEDSKMSLRLKIGVPVFITPDRVKKSLLIEDPVTNKEEIKVVLSNSGNTYEIIKTVTFLGLDNQSTLFSKEQRGWYILNGKKAEFRVSINESECSRLKKIAITVKTERDTLKREVEVEPGQCG